MITSGIVFTATRVILILSLAIIAIPTVAPAQSTASSASQPPGPEPLPPMPADANPSFDVATIKPSDNSAPHGTFFRTNGRHVIAYNISVGGLIAYGQSRSATSGDYADQRISDDDIPF